MPQRPACQRTEIPDPFSDPRHRDKTGDGYWKSFEAFLDATASTTRRASVDARLGFAASYFIRLSYKEAADLIRAGRIEEGLAKVPSYTRIAEKMLGRRAIANLETHHVATKEWARRLGVPEANLDEMPSLLLNKYWHNTYKSNLRDEYVFHKILREQMAGVNPADTDAVMTRLRATWRQFLGCEAGDPDPDVWIVIKAWLDRNRQQ